MGAHLGQQRVAHELQLVRRDVDGYVERGAQQLTAFILELYEQPLHIACRHIVLQKEAGRLSVPLHFPPAWGPHAETRRPRPVRVHLPPPPPPSCVPTWRRTEAERQSVASMSRSSRRPQRPLVFGGVRPLQRPGLPMGSPGDLPPCLLHYPSRDEFFNTFTRAILSSQPREVN